MVQTGPTGNTENGSGDTIGLIRHHPDSQSHSPPHHPPSNAKYITEAPDSPENAMKSSLLVAALSAALMSLSAFAQLGPAGVPGAPGLAETDPSVKPAQPVPVQPAVKSSPTVAEKKSPPTKRAKLAKKTRPQANCQAPSGKSNPRCAPKPSPKEQCSKASDPARCELHAKARETCRGKSGEPHRQCLRDTLVPKK